MLSKPKLKKIIKKSSVGRTREKKQKNGFRTLFARSIKILPEFHFYF